MEKQLLTVLMILINLCIGYAQQNQSVSIDYIHSGAIVVDEWKSPGLYSPVNIFDGNLNTIYAQRKCRSFRYESKGINFTVRFNRSVQIDEIRIMNGFGKNTDLFRKNSRIKSIRMELYADDGLKLDEKPTIETTVLNDTMEFQSLKFSKEHRVKLLKLITVDLYKGSKYDDTCMTELGFYYKGQKIKINDINNLKKEYITKVGNDLIKAFSDKTYVFDTDTWNDTVQLFKDGHIKYNQSDSYSNPPAKEIMPDSWKVENSRLYMKISGVWILYNYAIVESNPEGDPEGKTFWNIVLFTNPYEYVSNDHPYKIYYKRLPEDYKFEMFTP
jgi:hypothetical protein